MNVSEFARFLGMKQQTLDNYIKGRIPSVEFVVRLCSKCCVSADWLLGLESDNVPKEQAPRTNGECRECEKKDAVIAEQKVEIAEQRSIIMALSGAKQASLLQVETKSGGGGGECMNAPKQSNQVRHNHEK